MGVYCTGIKYSFISLLLNRDIIIRFNTLYTVDKILVVLICTDYSFLQGTDIIRTSRSSLQVHGQM